MEHALHLPLGTGSRYVVISDCHRGEGTTNDNFLKNAYLYEAAMEHYIKRGFFYLESRNALCRIYGNHNMELRKILPEAIILDNCEGGRDVCMIHGHQADFFNSVCWRLSRALVRYVWKPLERSGVNDPTSAARNYKKAVRYEQCLAGWTRLHDRYLIAGHSHRPRLPENGELYLNAGSCVHPGCITAIELEQMQMTLVKWKVATRPDMTMYVVREKLAGPAAIL